MSGELVTTSKELRVATVAEVRANVNLIQEVMKSVMKKDVHYGIIPGCKKPSLWKPGAEVILTTFRLVADNPVIEDLSSPDIIRYRITQRILNRSGELVGAASGECSSDEEKYKWRRPVCDEEFDETPEDRRREKWSRGQNGNYKQKQIRTNPADVANTILKMAVKRAVVAATLITTAASDVFDQDIEDIPQEYLDENGQATTAGKPEVKMPEEKKPEPQQPPKTNGGAVISEPQRKRLFAISNGSGYTHDEVESYLTKNYGISSTKDILREHYDDIVEHFKARKNG